MPSSSQSQHMEHLQRALCGVRSPVAHRGVWPRAAVILPALVCMLLYHAATLRGDAVGADVRSGTAIASPMRSFCPRQSFTSCPWRAQTLCIAPLDARLCSRPCKWWVSFMPYVTSAPKSRAMCVQIGKQRCCIRMLGATRFADFVYGASPPSVINCCPNPEPS